MKAYTKKVIVSGAVLAGALSGGAYYANLPPKRTLPACYADCRAYYHKCKGSSDETERSCQGDLFGCMGSCEYAIK